MSKEEQEANRRAEAEAKQKEAEEAARKAAEETSEESPEEEEDLSVEELKAKLAHERAERRKVNKEAKDRRLALEALEREKKEREEAELSEKDRLEKRATEAETKLADLEKANRSLRLSQEFESKTRSLKLEFVNDKAREDVFRLIDPEKIGDDFDGLEDELKQIVKERPYFFGKPDPNTFINDGSRKNKSGSRAPTQRIIEKKRAKIAPL